MQMTCVWKDINPKCLRTHTDVHTHGRTHVHTLTRHMCTCVHTHTHTDTCICDAYMHTPGQHTLQAHDTHHDVHTYTSVCTLHTPHTDTDCKSNNVKTFLVFLHTASILVCTEQRRESWVWPTIRWCNSVTAGKMALNILPCYFLKSSIISLEYTPVTQIILCIIFLIYVATIQSLNYRVQESKTCNLQSIFLTHLRLWSKVKVIKSTMTM